MSISIIMDTLCVKVNNNVQSKKGRKPFGTAEFHHII